MECPHCGSKNFETHIVKTDKQSRNILITLIVFFSIIGIMLVVGHNQGNSMMSSVIVSVIISIPVCVLLRIILSIIPAGHSVVLVCHDCGKQSIVG